MRANTLLVRWQGGYVECKDITSISAVGRIEARLDLGAINSLPEAIRVANEQLAEFARERTQVDVKIYPAGGDVPYEDFAVGDTITVESVSHRVLGMTVTFDQNTGRPIYTPTLNTDVVLGPEERVFQALRKMVNGTLGGRSKVAQPVVPIARPLGRAPVIAEVCETFTVADATPWGGTGDLAWTITVTDAGGLSIVSNRVVGRTDGSLISFGYEGGATTPDYGITSPDCWAEFDYVSNGDANVGTGEVDIALRAQSTWTGLAGGGVVLVFYIQTGVFSPYNPDPSWQYIVYDNTGTATPIDGTGSYQTGTPAGRWRYELEGDTARLFLNGVAFASGTDTALPTAYTGVGFLLNATRNTLIDTIGPIIDNVCAGNL